MQSVIPCCFFCLFQASSQEGASKVFELLQGKTFRSVGWRTLFDCLSIYEEKFKQSLQSAGGMLPEFQEGDAKALVAYLNVLQKVITLTSTFIFVPVNMYCLFVLIRWFIKRGSYVSDKSIFFLLRCSWHSPAFEMICSCQYCSLWSFLCSCLLRYLIFVWFSSSPPSLYFSYLFDILILCSQVQRLCNILLFL